MPEKVVLYLRTGTWIKVLAWMQMVCYGIKTLLYSLALIVILWEWGFTKAIAPRAFPNKSGDEDSLETQGEITKILSEFELESEAADFAHHFHHYQLVLAIVVFILAYISVVIMGGILLKGGKQNNVPCLKSWLVFAMISIFWHVLIVIISLHPMELLEMIIFIPFYSFGIFIVYTHMKCILINQNPGGEELPKYETMEEDLV